MLAQAQINVKEKYALYEQLSKSMNPAKPTPPAPPAAPPPKA
jgi:hypothetical protein